MPAIKKVRGWQPKCKLIDTLLMSRMLFPNIGDKDFIKRPKDMPQRLYGSHSLKAWGYRLSEFKGDYDGGWN